MRIKLFLISLVLLFMLQSPVQGHPAETRDGEIDDAVVIESADSGSLGTGDITSPDGPGPSMLGSLDKIFKSVKDFDQYQCIERMMCEYMQGNSDIGGLGGILGGGSSGGSTGSALGGIPGLSGLAGLLGGVGQTGGVTAGAPVRGQFPPPQGFPGDPSDFTRPTRGVGQQQFFNQPGGFPQQGGFPPQGAFPQQGFPQQGFPPQGFPPQGFQPQPQPPSGGLFGTIENLLFGKRRRSKRQTNLQGNLIRLMQATKLDNLHAFPYIRAALVGYGSKGQGITRAGQGSCSQLYRQCPTEPNQLLHYINNHNGGLVNQVQPSVDNEVAPILSAIVGDVLGSGSSSSSAAAATSTKLSTSTASPTFAAADSFITNALVQGASGPFSNALTSLANLISGNSNKTK